MCSVHKEKKTLPTRNGSLEISVITLWPHLLTRMIPCLFSEICLRFLGKGFWMLLTDKVYTSLVH